jgi:hypothetical protein
MRRQYQINHRTRNTRFDRQELIARLGNNRVSTHRGGSTEPPVDAPLQPEPPDKDKEVVVDSGVTPSPGSASKRKCMAYLKAQDSDTARKQVRETVPEVPPVPDAPDVPDKQETRELRRSNISSDSDKPSNSEGNHSLSFGSDTDYLSVTYVILDAEVKRNGSIALASLLRPGAIQETTLILEEDPIERTVFFPIFSRYFVAKGRSFENMVADLIHHREANQNEGAPLIVKADVPKLRQIAHKRMGFLKATYRIFKDSTSSGPERCHVKCGGYLQRRGNETHRGISGRPHDANRLQVTTETMIYFSSRDGACQRILQSTGRK